MSQASATTESPTSREQGVDEIPVASEEAIQFVNDINEEDFKFLLYPDNLAIVSDTGKELGEFNVTIEPAKYHETTDCFLVHANSQGLIDNVPCGTTITSFVTKELETLEQQHHEYVKLENHPLDRRTFLQRQGSEMIINRATSQGEDIRRSSRSIPVENIPGFISEGSNLLLQRLLVNKAFPDNLKFLSFDAEANLCPAIYTKLDERTQVVDETELDVYGIERTIASVDDIPTSWQSYFIKDGHLTSRVQVGSPVAMRVLKVPEPVEDEDKIEKPTFEKKELNWEEDSELYSKFLERKSQLKNDHAVYMRHHPELKALLSDFMGFLLLRKPENTISFAADFFSSFSHKMPNPSPYQQSSAPSPFSNTATSPKIKHLSQNLL